MINRLMQRIIEKWDWWVYNRACRSMRRLCRRYQTFGYFMLLHIDNFVAENPPTELQKASILRYYNSLPKIKR